MLLDASCCFVEFNPSDDAGVGRAPVPRCPPRLLYVDAVRSLAPTRSPPSNSRHETCSPIMPQWMEPTEPAREVFARLLISLKHELVYGGSNGVYSGVGVISASGGSHLSGSGNQQNVASSATVHDLKDILSKLLKAWNDTPYSVLRLNSAAAAFMHSRPRAGSPNVVTPLPAGSPVGGISSSASSTPGSAGPSGTGGVNWGQLSSLLKSRVGFGASATIAHDDNGTRVRGGSGADSYGVVDDSEMDGDGAGIGLAFSNSSSAVSLDRLHAAAISASSAAASPQQNSGPSPPPAQAWTPFQTLISRLHGFDYTVSVNALQGKPISTPVRETLAVMAAQAGQVISPQPSPTTPTLSLVGHGLWHGSAHTQTQYQPAVSVGGHAVSAWAAIGASPLSSAQQQPQEQAKGSGNAFRGFPSGTPASTNTVTSVTSGGYGFVPTPSSSSSLAPAAASSSSSDSASSAAAAAAAAASLVPRPGPMYGNGFVSYSMGMASPTAASAAAAASRSPQHMSAAAGFNSASGSFSGWGQPAATQAQAAGGGLSSNGFAHEGSSSGSNGSWTSSGLQNAHAAASMHPSYLHAGVHAHSSSSAVSSGFSRYGDGMDDL